jgi:hypothetical protein
MFGKITYRMIALYCCTAIALVCFNGIALFKAHQMDQLYEESSQSLQARIEDVAAGVKSGDLELSNERLAIVLVVAADRTLESQVISRLYTYLIIFILLFSIAAFALLDKSLREKKHE